MRWLIVILTLLVAGAILGPISSGNAGYVLVQFAGWSLETSVISLAIILVVSVVAIALVIAVLTAILNRTQKGGRWFKKRRQQKAQTRMTEGLQQLLQQNYLAALSAFEKAHKKDSADTAAALASYSAQQSTEFGKAEFWRDQAGKDYQNTGWILSVKKIAAAKQNDPESAAGKMNLLLKRDPQDKETWRLATEVYQAAKHWKQLARIMPSIEKYAEYSQQEIDSLKQKISYQRFLEESANGNESLMSYWNSLTKSERNTDVIRLSYALALKEKSNKEACAKIVYKGLKRGVMTIEQANQLKLLFASYPKLVEHVQETLKRNPEHSGYLKALAFLAIDSKDYSLAQRALKKLIEKHPETDNYKLLGDVYNALGDSQLAANAYQKALA